MHIFCYLYVFFFSEYYFDEGRNTSTQIDSPSKTVTYSRRPLRGTFGNLIPFDTRQQNFEIRDTSVKWEANSHILSVIPLHNSNPTTNPNPDPQPQPLTINPKP